MSTLYILQLEHGKWYVGKTDDMSKRYTEHKAGNGSMWTKLHKPVKIVETRKIVSEHDETNVTKDYMKKYGIDNVRGGAYCQVELPNYIEETIKHELRSKDDRCYKCGKSGHFANVCTKKSSFTGTCECGEKFLDFDEYMSHMKGCRIRNNSKPKYPGGITQYGIHCSRCGRTGHWATSCYAKKDVDGNDLSDEDEYESE